MGSIYTLPVIRTVADCEREFPDVITISHYTTYEQFDNLYYHVYYALCACIEIPECRSFKIRFKFYTGDDVTYELSMCKFLLNLNAWRPLVELNSVQENYRSNIEVMDDSFIVGTLMSDTKRTGLESKVLQVLDDYGIPYEIKSQLLKTTIERYQAISVEFALTSASEIMTLESIFLNDYRNSPVIRDLNNTKISQEIQTSDVEEILRKKTAELFAEFKRTKNPISYILQAGNHIKPKQVQELFISYGQIPDVMGNVIPYTMEGNGFSTGYSDPTSYYIAGTGARLSAVVNKQHMGEAGYLTRNLELSARTLTLSTTVFDCGTKHLVEVTVTNSTFLHRLENRWYKEHEGETLKLIHYADCRHLIGKKIKIRSPITCACGDGEICNVCYGRDSHLVVNMPGMAIYNTQIYSEPVSQNILSTKHLLFTLANKIFFSETFSKYFCYRSGDIYLIDREDWDESFDVSKLYVRIEEPNMIPVNNADIADMSAFGNNVESPFYVYNSATGVYERIEILNYESMFIDAESMKSFRLVAAKKSEGGKKYYEISFVDLSSELEGRLMSIAIKNNGLTDNLYTIMNLVDKNAAKYESYHQLAQDFFELLINAGIKCRHIQAEIILNRLIRDADNIYHRPKFSEFQEPHYKIINLNQSLTRHPAPTIGTSYQELKRQITSGDIFTKTGAAYTDALYAEKIPTKRLRELIERAKARKAKLNGDSKPNS